MIGTAAAPASPLTWLDRAGRSLLAIFLYAPRFSPARQLQRSLIRRAHTHGATYFTVTTDDGHTIDALHLPPILQPGERPRTPVVFTHGYMEVKEFYLRTAVMLQRRGHPVILHDLRAHGRSAGRHITFGARERHDLKAVLDHAQSNRLIGDRIISMGMSLGGATVLLHAALDPRVIGVVSFAPFADAGLAVGDYHRKYAWPIPRSFVAHSFELAATRAGFDIGDTSALQHASNLHMPVLLVVGQRDTNLPANQHTRPILHALPQGRCSLLEIPSANHFNLMSRTWPGMDEHVLEFCDGIECAG